MTIRLEYLSNLIVILFNLVIYLIIYLDSIFFKTTENLVK